MFTVNYSVMPLKRPTKEDKDLIIELFTSTKENTTRAISKITGWSEYYVDKTIDEYLGKK